MILLLCLLIVVLDDEELVCLLRRDMIEQRQGGDMTERQIREWPVLVKIANEYNLSPEDTILLLAIRDAENGPAGYEFGVKAAKGTNLDTQARWAAGSIRANRARYQRLLQEGLYEGTGRIITIGEPAEGVIKVPSDIDFIDFMGYYGSPTGYGWAPIHYQDMPEEEKRLNLNWAENVKKLYEKYSKMIKEKGVPLK